MWRPYLRCYCWRWVSIGIQISVTCSFMKTWPQLCHQKNFIQHLKRKKNHKPKNIFFYNPEIKAKKHIFFNKSSVIHISTQQYFSLHSFIIWWVSLVPMVPDIKPLPSAGRWTLMKGAEFLLKMNYEMFACMNMSIIYSSWPVSAEYDLLGWSFVCFKELS